MKQQLKPLALPILMLFMVGCAAILPGQDKVLVSAQRSITSGHQVVYGLYRLESENYQFFKAKAPDQAVAVRRQVNVLRLNFPQIEQDAWNAVEAYRQENSSANKSNLSVALAVLSQIVKDAQSYASQINSAK